MSQWQLMTAVHHLSILKNLLSPVLCNQGKIIPWEKSDCTQADGRASANLPSSSRTAVSPLGPGKLQDMAAWETQRDSSTVPCSPRLRAHLPTPALPAGIPMPTNGCAAYPKEWRTVCEVVLLYPLPPTA